jgi:prophage regulatory protein
MDKLNREKTGRRLLRSPEVEDRTQRSRVQCWRDIKAGKFPAPVELGPNSVGWFEDEIEAWLATRPRRTYRAKAPKEIQPDQPDRPHEKAQRPEGKTKRMPPTPRRRALQKRKPVSSAVAG